MSEAGNELGVHRSAFSSILGPVDETSVKEGGEARRLPLHRLGPKEGQPRRYFDEQKLAELTRSVRRHGVLEPLLVRPVGGGRFEIVAGERRYRAADAAGLETVPVVVSDMGEGEALEVALLENLQREDLNPLEETEAILSLTRIALSRSGAGDPGLEGTVALLYRMDNSHRSAARSAGRSVGRSGEGRADATGATQNVMGGEPEGVAGGGRGAADAGGHASAERVVLEVFDALGLMDWRSFVKNRLPVLRLPDDLLEALRGGELAYTKAVILGRVKDGEARRSLLEAIKTDELSVAQVRERVKKIIEAEAGAEHRARSDVSGQVRRRARAVLGKLSRGAQLEKTLGDANKRQRLQRLLSEMESLLEAPE